MKTLRVAFLSGAVLELAATLGIALVAVTIGVRLVRGGIGLEAGLTVLLLAPELYLPLRNLAAQFHAAADGRAAADRLLDLVELPPAARSGTASPPSPELAPVRLEAVTFAYPARPGPVLDAIDLELAPGETVAVVGPERVREEHGRSAAAETRRADGRTDHGRLARSRLLRLAGVARAARLASAAPDALPRQHRRQRAARRSAGRRRAGAPSRGARGRRRFHPGAPGRL